MKTNAFGRTGIQVSELCLGAMTFGAPSGSGPWQVIAGLEQNQVDRLVGTALDAGVNFVDTADVYSEGMSEILLGKALGKRRRDVVLATKCRGRMGPGVNDFGLSRRHVMDAIDASLKRLGTDYVDLYQIHGLDPATPFDETMRALEDVVRAGKARYLGCSNLASWHVVKANAIAERHGWARFESLQAYYTIAGRDLEREIVPMLEDQRMALMVWSPLAGGLLSGKYARDAKGPEGARRSQFDFPPVNRDRAFDCVDAMRKIADARGQSVARVALAWLLAKRHVTSIIIGAKNEQQLKDNLAATELTLSPEEIAALDRVSELPPEYPGWMIQWQASGGARAAQKK